MAATTRTTAVDTAAVRFALRIRAQFNVGVVETPLKTDEFTLYDPRIVVPWWYIERHRPVYPLAWWVDTPGQTEVPSALSWAVRKGILLDDGRSASGLRLVVIGRSGRKIATCAAAGRSEDYYRNVAGHIQRLVDRGEAF